MPLKVNEMVIQAKFCGEDEAQGAGSAAAGAASNGIEKAKDLELLREDIIKDCMEKVEEYLEKRQMR